MLEVCQSRPVLCCSKSGELVTTATKFAYKHTCQSMLYTNWCAAFFCRRCIDTAHWTRNSGRSSSVVATCSTAPGRNSQREASGFCLRNETSRAAYLLKVMWKYRKSPNKRHSRRGRPSALHIWGNTVGIMQLLNCTGNWWRSHDRCQPEQLQESNRNPLKSGADGS